MPSSPEEMSAAMLKNMPEKTGKTLPQWLKIVRATKLTKHGQIVKHLKTEHAVTHGYANLIAVQALQDPDEKPPIDNELVDAQYAGLKVHLCPIYSAII